MNRGTGAITVQGAKATALPTGARLGLPFAEDQLPGNLFISSRVQFSNRIS